MSRRDGIQFFALRQPPPGIVEISGQGYRLVRIFKHDFFAATCLYERADGDTENGSPVRTLPEKIVVKFGREQTFCGIGMKWLAEFMQSHEEGIYRALRGVDGIPRWVGRIGSTGYAIEYINAVPLDHLDSPPRGFFDRLRKIFDDIHSRNVAYGDANKRSNVLVNDAGKPFLIDFQISLKCDAKTPFPVSPLLRAIIRYIQDRDIYHLYKHKRKLSPQELTPEEEKISRKRGRLHTLHRKLTKPYRSIRRAFLKKKYDSGTLVSPTKNLEDHHQPEKNWWSKQKPRLVLDLNIAGCYNANDSNIFKQRNGGQYSANFINTKTKK